MCIKGLFSFLKLMCIKSLFSFAIIKKYCKKQWKDFIKNNYPQSQFECLE